MIQWAFQGKNLVSTDFRFHISEHRDGNAAYSVVYDSLTGGYYPRPILEDPTAFAEELLRKEAGMHTIRWHVSKVGRLASEGREFLIKGPFSAGMTVRFVLLRRNPGGPPKRYLCLTEQACIDLANDLAAGKGVLEP